MDNGWTKDYIKYEDGSEQKVEYTITKDNILISEINVNGSREPLREPNNYELKELGFEDQIKEKWPFWVEPFK